MAMPRERRGDSPGARGPGRGYGSRRLERKKNLPAGTNHAQWPRRLADGRLATTRGLWNKGLPAMSASALRLIERDDMDKGKALDAALSQIERAFGKGSIMKLGQRQGAVEAEAISTGSIGLDIALGIGGLPRGRIVEIYGPESSGKTTLALHAIAAAQKAGGTCAFVDAEHALDPAYARKLGVDVDELLISQPDAGEQALEIADTLVRSGAIDVLVVDSVAALVPRAELEGEMGDNHMGLHARLMSQALRKLTGSIAKSRTMVIFINQIRMKIGVMFGNPETTTGGNALKFYASVRLDIRRIGAIKEKDEVVGNQTRVKVVKNKMAAPFRVVDFDIMYGEGISKTGELIDLGVQAGIVEKSGAWISYDGQRIGQGRENAKAFLRQNPEVAAKIEAAIRANAGLVASGMMKGGETAEADGE
jgi:recombination protein RecA